MIRTPLQRKTSLKRRTKLKPVSAKKRDWNRLYADSKADAPLEMECADCGTPWMKWRMEPHHPAGRIGANIMRFVWLCRPCHLMIHHKSKWARETGRLLPEYEGRKGYKNAVNYFNV